MSGDITSSTNVKLSLKDTLIIVGVIVSSTIWILSYFNIIPAQGSETTDLKINQDLATKEYVSVNYVSKEKLFDTVIILQNQITSYKEAIDKIDKKVDVIIDRLPPR